MCSIIKEGFLPRMSDNIVEKDLEIICPNCSSNMDYNLINSDSEQQSALSSYKLVCSECGLTAEVDIDLSFNKIHNAEIVNSEGMMCLPRVRQQNTEFVKDITEQFQKNCEEK